MFFVKSRLSGVINILLIGLCASPTVIADRADSHPNRQAEGETGGWNPQWPANDPKLRPLSPFMVTLSASGILANGGATQTFFLQPTVEKTYVSQSDMRGIVGGEVFLGYVHQLSTHLQGQLGVAAVTTSNAQLKGDIWEDADPNFNNYTYSYNLTHTHVALKGKLLADAGMWAQPYVSASIGGAFNNAKSFIITPDIDQEVPAPAFTDNSTTSFTYTLGIGVQRVLNRHVQVGIGYEFADWGKSQLGAAPGQTLNSGLSVNNFYTNAVQLSFSFRA